MESGMLNLHQNMTLFQMQHMKGVSKTIYPELIFQGHIH